MADAGDGVGKGVGKEVGKVGASAATKRWREVVRGPPCRDRSPLPESVPAPYKKLRAPDERSWVLESLEMRREQVRQEQGREKAYSKIPTRRTKTDIAVTAEDLNKLFYERDILKDKLRRRNEELDAFQ